MLFMSGNAPRHIHIAAQLYRSGFLKAWVIEEREAFVPEPPAGISSDLKGLFIRHFRERQESEHRFFSDGLKTGIKVPQLLISREELNSPKVISFCRAHSSELLLSYGVHKLQPSVLECFPECWNIHGGLSPWYRGVATLFWPSYFLEPQMTGITLHETTSKIDGGAIIHQTKAPLFEEDGIHDLANRAVSAFTKELPEILQRKVSGGLAAPEEQKTAGRLWLASDWRPEHLRLIYETYENRIVARYLNNRL